MTRPHVDKLKNGEYLYTWNGYDPILLGGPYSDYLNVGEERFYNCIGYFSGICDVDWWVKEELDKLTPPELAELENICEYKKYVNKTITPELMEKLAVLYGCERHHIYRIGKYAIKNLCADLYAAAKLIRKHSSTDQNLKSVTYLDSINMLRCLSFEEYKKTRNLHLGLILAMDENGGIGLENDLPWGRTQKADLANFKKLTTPPKEDDEQAVTVEQEKHAVIMGRNTWESLPKKFRPLPDRLNIILSTTYDPGVMNKDASSDYTNVLVAPDMDKAIEMASKAGMTHVWFIGGVSVYKEAIKIANTVHLTIIHNTFPADTYISIHDTLKADYYFDNGTRYPADENNDNPYSFRVWKRK